MVVNNALLFIVVKRGNVIYNKTDNFK